MPLIDTVKRITTEEFKPEDREVAERIGNIYNYFAEQVTNVLNGNVDFDNLQRSLLEIQVIVDANGNPIQRTQFSTSVGLNGTKTIRAINLTNTVNYLQSSPFISFSSDGTGIYTINNITGLNAGESYRLTVELIF